MRDELIRRELLARLRLLVEALALLALPLRRSRIHRQHEVATRLVTRIADGRQDVLDRVLVALEVRSKAALIADSRRLPFLLEQRLQRMEDLCRPAQSLAEGRCAGRHDHELLRVDRVRRMRAAVQDVHHRHRQVIAADAAEEAVEREVERYGRGLCRCERDGEDGVRAEVRLVFRDVELEHDGIDRIDVRRIRADESRGDLLVDIRDSFRDALAAELRLVAVAELERLELARRSARRSSGAADGAVLERDFCLDRRIAARIDDFTADDLHDL